MAQVNSISDFFSKPWRKLATGMKAMGRQIKYYWYRDTGFTQQVLEELCHIDNMADFRAVLAAASGYYLPARHLFNTDGTPKYKTEICADATEMVNRLQKDISTKSARYQSDLVKMGYWSSQNQGLILGIWYWFFVNNGDKDKSKVINRLIHDTYYEWEDIMAEDVDYKTEAVEKELGKLICKHCADDDLKADELRALILKEHPNIDVLAFMTPYGQLLGPAGICKSMALMVTTLKKRRIALSDVQSERF